MYLRLLHFFDIQELHNDTILSAYPMHISWTISSGMIQNNPLFYVILLSDICNTAIFLLQLI